MLWLGCLRASTYRSEAKPKLAVAVAGVGLFLYVNPYQSVVAYEWLVGGLEPKSVAYGLLLLAIGLMLGGRYRWMALMLGLATHFMFW
jgi:hypothetical protein